MKNKEYPQRPSDGELAILKVLWKQGPCTVRQVHETLGQETGYTTVLKLMQIMAEKKLVLRDEESRAHLYRAAVKQDAVECSLVSRMIAGVFEGSAANLVMRALSTRKASPAELAQIRKMLDDAEKKGGKS